jgi:RimJ/RimL family protein N-acetyltransferase
MIETERLVLTHLADRDAEFIRGLLNEPSFLRFIGDRGVLKRDTLPEPDLGFSLLPAYWSIGYAHEAASAVMQQARGPLGLGRILAITSVDNVPSIKLLDTLGFRFERMIRLGEDTTELRLFASKP